MSLFDTGSDAVISADGTYRYTLTRSRSEGAGHVAWVMLNPSTADASEDDPTIRRVKGFSWGWGYQRLTVVNLFAYRATKPAELVAAGAPPGPENDDHLAAVCGGADRVVAAWGAHKIAALAAKRFLALGFPVVALGVTADGSPRHPLYVKADTEPTPYPPARPPSARGAPVLMPTPPDPEEAKMPDTTPDEAAVEALAEAIWRGRHPYTAPEFWRGVDPGEKALYIDQARAALGAISEGHVPNVAHVPPGSRVVSEGQGVVDGEVVNVSAGNPEFSPRWAVLTEPEPEPPLPLTRIGYPLFPNGPQPNPPVEPQP